MPISRLRSSGARELIPLGRPRCNTTPRHVRRLVFERRIAFRKLGRYVRFHPDDLEEFITANRVEVGGDAAHRPVVVVRRRRS